MVLLKFDVQVSDQRILLRRNQGFHYLFEKLEQQVLIIILLRQILTLKVQSFFASGLSRQAGIPPSERYSD
jgi:hypothetical protein